MPMVDGDWSVDRATGDIRYIGYDHTGGSVITAGSFVTGDYYQIRNVGSTDFTLIGAASNTVGVRFEATGAGSGTGDATQIASYATGIEFHRWAQAKGHDEIFAGDDEYDIIDRTLSERQGIDNIIQLKDHSAVGGVTYNMDATAIEHIYDCSIIQRGGDEIYDGFVNYGVPAAHIQLRQDGAIISDDWWNYAWQGGTHTGGADASVLTDSTQSWTTDEWVGYTIKNTTDGSQGIITANTATTITADLEGGTENDWDASDAYKIAVPVNPDATAGISHRFLVQVRADGVDIDRRSILSTGRRWGKTWAEFPVFATARGNNTLAITDSDDVNNTTAATTVATWTTITNTEGLRLLDIDNDSVNEEYASEWNRDTFTINQFTERLKWLARDGSTSTINGQNGELHRGITHSFAYDNETGGAPATNDKWIWGTEIAYDTGSGTFTVGEAIHGPGATPAWKGRVLGGQLNAATPGTLIVDLESGTLTDNDTFTGQTSAASADLNDATPPTAPTATAGEMLFMAVDDDGTTGNLYGQLTKGRAPVDDTRIYDETTVAQFLDVNGSVTAREIKVPFFGQSTGTALLGAYGLGMETADTSSSDRFVDLSGANITPPNNVTFTVNGTVASEFRVLVTNDDGATGIDFTQMATDTTLSGAAETSVSINPAPGIPADTPSPSGTIRIERDNGAYTRHAYTAVDTSTDTFTIPSTDFSTNNATSPANVFVTYIDKLATAGSESFNTVYDSDRTLFIRVRDGFAASPIKDIETTGDLGSNGGSVTLNPLSDL